MKMTSITKVLKIIKCSTVNREIFVLKIFCVKILCVNFSEKIHAMKKNYAKFF